MRQHVLNATVSSIILIGHLSIILLILAMYLRSGFTFSEATTTLSIFIPITSVYTSAIIKDAVAIKETINIKRKYIHWGSS
jgi:ABC-type lipoprotein release transport system permease subunit